MAKIVFNEETGQPLREPNFRSPYATAFTLTGKRNMENRKPTKRRRVNTSKYKQLED